MIPYIIKLYLASKQVVMVSLYLYYNNMQDNSLVLQLTYNLMHNFIKIHP